MRSLPQEIISILLSFAPLFSARKPKTTPPQPYHRMVSQTQTHLCRRLSRDPTTALADFFHLRKPTRPNENSPNPI